MPVPKTWKGVVRHFKALPPEITNYFVYLPNLAASFPWEVSLSYLFGRIELGHNMAIYCGVVKLHRAEKSLAWTAIQKHRMTRGDFKKLFETVHGKPIPNAIGTKLEDAERIRDKAMHGKDATAAEQRRAVADVLDYSRELNDFVHNLSGFRPFDDLRGFKGRGVALDSSTTRWLLRGIGFAL